MHIRDLSYPEDYTAITCTDITKYTVDGILKYAADKGYSDIFIESGDKIRAKIKGYHIYLTHEPLESTQVQNFARILVKEDSNRLLRLFEAKGINDRYLISDPTDRNKQLAFRLNITACEPHTVQETSAISIAIRVIDETARLPEELGVSETIVSHWHNMRKGLVLVIGATGEGKTTTLHSLVRSTLTNPCNKRILEFSRPIEFTHFNYEWDPSCHISQLAIREGITGGHLQNYEDAIAQMVRKKPDIVLFSEMTELESFKAALAACNTGHTMASTLHANDVSSGFSRIFQMFPPAERESLYHELISSGEIFISQRLIRSSDGGLVACFEYLLITPNTKDRLYKVKTESELKQLVKAILVENGTSFKCDARKLLNQGRISDEEYQSFIASF